MFDSHSNKLLKNATPRQIAISASLVIAFSVAILYLLSVLLHVRLNTWIRHIIFFFAIWLISYGIIAYVLRNYIYRKIKLIYKSIYQTKVSTKNKGLEVNMNEDIISEVKEEVSHWAEVKTKEIEALKSLEEYRRNFLGDISHELKTPLFNIQGYVHSLLEGGLYDAQVNQSFLEKASKNIDRLQVIIDDLDTISKLESGRLVLEMKQFNIRELVMEVMNDLEDIARSQKVSLGFKEGASKGYMVYADYETIRQVLVNLITNSIKYGREGGYTKLAFYDMDDLVLIEVADNGIGIPKEHIKYIFDRFYRVDKSRSRERGGSGLGLSIVKHIIEAHDQTVNVRSDTQLGSTFGFTLEKVN